MKEKSIPTLLQAFFLFRFSLSTKSCFQGLILSLVKNRIPFLGRCSRLRNLHGDLLIHVSFSRFSGQGWRKQKLTHHRCIVCIPWCSRNDQRINGLCGLSPYCKRQISFTFLPLISGCLWIYLSIVFIIQYGIKKKGMKNRRMKAARALLGFTQDDLAQKAGVTRQTINMIESGDLKCFRRKPNISYNCPKTIGSNKKPQVSSSFTSKDAFILSSFASKRERISSLLIFS